MKELHLVVVNKLKSRELESIEKNYHDRISLPQLKIHELKSGTKDFESKQILSKCDEISSKAHKVVLMETGDLLSSQDFSQFIFKKLEGFKDLVFIICGAEGPTQQLVDACQAKLSLSPLTFPHKLARIIFVEQLYRAITIKNNHPYHN